LPKISVIVPVYNMEKYLNRCVDSILLQSFSDFEVILVDDGSKDTSGDICDSYALSDSRIRVIHKENGGVSAARNAALNIASGEYITFCDSDDYVETDWLKQLYDNVVNDNFVDVVSMNFNVVGEENDILTKPSEYLQFKKYFDSEHDVIKYLISDILCGRAGWSVCIRIFKKSILNKYNIRFCESCNNYAEDMIFVLEYTLKAKGVQVLNYRGYNYFQRSNSMMHKSENVIRLNDLNECSNHFGNFVFKYIKNKRYANKYLPVFHWFMMNIEYKGMIENQTILNLPLEIDKISNISWYKKMTGKIFFHYRFFTKIYGRKKAMEIFMVSSFCIHKNKKIFGIESKIYYDIFK